MAGDPRIRASDEDRERSVSLLREHHAAGRLTLDEFSERLDKAYAAKTLGELDELMSDLPAIDLYRLPDAQLPPHYRRQIPGRGGYLQAAQVGGGVVSPHGRFSPAWAANRSFLVGTALLGDWAATTWARSRQATKPP